MAYRYADGHACEGRDRAKWRFLACLAIGAAIGAPAGVKVGRAVVGYACGRPNAGNLCGFIPSLFIPGYMFIGAVLGALGTALVMMVAARFLHSR
jgi:hypothetical protein